MDLVCATSIHPQESDLLYEEWLVTNGLGGFACGSIDGAPMRKYHNLLQAPLSRPFGRTSMLSFVADSLIVPDKHKVYLSQVRFKDQRPPLPKMPLVEFRTENGLPIWRYQLDDIIIEKNIWMPYFQNSLIIRYHLISANQPLVLKWRPYFNFRNIEQALSLETGQDISYEVRAKDSYYEITSLPYPTVRLFNGKDKPFILDGDQLNDVFFEIEQARGYDSLSLLKSPGFFLSILQPEEKTSFFCSIEPWKVMQAMTAEEAWIAEKQRRKILLKSAKHLQHSKTASKLVLAADQFIMTPNAREDDVVRLQAIGEDVRSIIAGFPWFTDWGRDTMISLEGLTLTTGRVHAAHAILRTFGYYIKNGLIPNMFPDGESQGLYHTADATLWFFHAVDRYVTLTQDEEILEFFLPKFQKIIEHHIKGTDFGIKVDEDGLLIQGQEGYQLTWMDAKVGDLIVTPRRGKAVEINALWYNALRLMEEWTGKELEITKRCRHSFNEKFWYEEGGYLYDVINGETGKDASLRPNQLFAISLKYPILDEKYWKSVLDIVKKDLLTDYGLRTLSPSHPDYKAYYHGDLLARDAAYHQGTVWPWLIGPFIDVWLKVYPEATEEAKTFLNGLERYLNSHYIGSISEIFDASDPFCSRGCFAQAWSVAEFLRVYVKLYPN